MKKSVIDKGHFVDVAYGVLSNKYANKKTNFENQNDESKQKWEILTTSAEHQETNQYAYKSVAFINHETKEMHFATAGTNPGHVSDLFDDLKLTVGGMTSKLNPMKKFVSKAIEKAGCDLSGYTFSTSGHSLGAVVSDLTAGEIMSRGYTFAKSTTFDTPGSKALVKQALESNLFSGQVKNTLDDIADKCREFNARPNLINTATEHLAKNINVVLSADKKVISEQDPEKSSSGVWGFANYLYKTVGQTVKTCSDYLGITKTLNAVIQLEEHKLCNILAAEVALPVNNWSKSLSIDCSKEVFEKLSGKKVDQTKPKALVTTVDDDFVYLDECNYSHFTEISHDVDLIGHKVFEAA